MVLLYCPIDEHLGASRKLIDEIEVADVAGQHGHAPHPRIQVKDRVIQTPKLLPLAVVSEPEQEPGHDARFEPDRRTGRMNAVSFHGADQLRDGGAGLSRAGMRGFQSPERMAEFRDTGGQMIAGSQTEKPVNGRRGPALENVDINGRIQEELAADGRRVISERQLIAGPSA